MKVLSLKCTNLVCREDKYFWMGDVVILHLGAQSYVHVVRLKWYLDDCNWFLSS